MGKAELTQELQEAIRRKDWRGAVNALNRLVKLEPRNAPHRLKMGDYYSKLGDKGKALSSYQKAAELFGEDGFIVKALAAYKIILRLDPGNQKARSGMEGLHSHAKEQALELSVSIPKTPSISGDLRRGGVQAPVMDAWEISKSHLLKDIEKSAGESPGGPAFPEAMPAPAPPSQAAAGEGSSPPKEEVLDEALIGSPPVDLDAYVESKKPDEDAEKGTVSVSGGVPGPVDSGPDTSPRPGQDLPSGEFSGKPILPSGGAGSNVLTLFSSLTKEEFAEVTDRMNPYLFEPGAKIVSEGDAGDSVFVVSSGTVQVSTTIGRKEVVLAELKDDDFFGEVSFLTGRPRTADIIARSATEILELPGDDLRAVIEKFPRVRAVLEEFHRVRALDTVEKIMPPGKEGPGDAD